MTSGLQTIIHPVRDLARATRLYTELLGAPPYLDQPYYVGFRVGCQELGLDPHGHAQGMTGHVEDVRERVAALVGAGVAVHQEVRDVGGGRLVASLTDADGNVIGLLQA